MIGIINVLLLIFFTVMTLVIYWISVSPAGMEKIFGSKSYKICTFFRFFSGFSMLGAFACYVGYKFFPLAIPIPAEFGWGYGVSVVIAIAVTIPAILLHIKGIKDAGKESMIPDKEHTLYKGIYKYIRHPQAVGEVVLWWTAAFLLNSPFLVLYSVVWIPIFIFMCVAEERDLVIRYGEPYEAYRRQTGMFFPRINMPGKVLKGEESLD